VMSSPVTGLDDIGSPSLSDGPASPGSVSLVIPHFHQR
jgi:hypothetical protein